MKKLYTVIIFCCLCTAWVNVSAQTTVRGKVLDAETGEDLVGASIALVDGSGGALTNYEGEFVLKVASLPAKIKISYTGFNTEEITVTDAAARLNVKLSTNAILIAETTVIGQRIDEKQKAAPLTVEKLDAIAIKETAAVSFYNGLGNLKGVDLTTASLGFTVINTRGFNSTSPVRSLQTIDGVDNQAPGLNFSLGNFLGASDLDVSSVDLVVGASSAFYGPNAFNGVIAMKSKNPFTDKGLAVSLKGGERQLLEGAFRWADALKNKSGDEFFAYKFNFFGLRANDWVADNYDPISDAVGNSIFQPAENPGRFNGVNIYGDEFVGEFLTRGDSRAGLNSFHRTGYKEIDLVDYNTRNVKIGGALHFRLKPSQGFESPELVISSNYGTGTTVYQGDNRFSLRGIRFLQNRLELMKKDKYFLRFYSTNEDAGRSYDPYFTALQMQRAAKSNNQWSNDYQAWWVRNDLGAVFRKMREQGYGPLSDPEALADWQRRNIGQLRDWHTQAAAHADRASVAGTANFFEPGTARFDSLFQVITSRKNTEGGTRFFDKSALYHVHGEHQFVFKGLDKFVVGANGRLYRPVSEGTIFSDSAGQIIRNYEWGAYLGAEKQIRRVRLSATVRVDKNQNFNYLATPAASVVWTPGKNNYLRLSFSSAIRNPTLTDQYLNLRVGPATLVGNLEGFDSLILLNSFREYSLTGDARLLQYENIAPIRPERVQTIEVGYRTTLFKRVYMDAGYYYNTYRDFIGFNIGVTLPFTNAGGFSFPDFGRLAVWRVAANARGIVTTQGASIGLNYYFSQYYMVQGNYSWNRLNTQERDPIVPAFNTPEHKFNVGFSGRDMPLKLGNANLKWAFNINYKWIQGFVFEGSPQFTGNIPTYSLLDAQVNVVIPKWSTTLKLGAANLLDNQQFQVYGGPRIGRMAYIQLLYDWRKKIEVR